MIEALLKGITLGLLLNLSVGPIVFSVIKQSLNNGHKGGMAFIIGVSASDIFLAVLSNTFTELFAGISDYRVEIGIAGSIFLMVLGIYFLLFKKVKVDDKGKQVFTHFGKSDFIKTSLSGFFMNLLNPAIFLFWLTTSTTFISHTIEQRLIIFITCLVLVFAGDTAKVMLAGKIRNRLTPHNIHIINRINGLILIGFGIAMIWGLLAYGDRI